MKKMFLGLMLSVAVCAISPVHAMDVPQEITQNRTVICVPEQFPGHELKPIHRIVKISDSFDPKDYQQNKARNDGACAFNSFLAGLMHTDYGRTMIQGLIESQDDTHVYIRFYFPNSDTLKQFEKSYLRDMEERQGYLNEMQDELKNTTDENEIKELNECITRHSNALEEIPQLWKKVLQYSHTVVKVPKKFATRLNPVKGSFPHNNPEWVNLIQQAYMKITKNPYVRDRASEGGYTSFGNLCEQIEDGDIFWGVPKCKFNSVVSYNCEFATCPLNIIDANPSLELFPLVNIPLKSIRILLNENGLDFHNITDAKVENQPDGVTIYKPLSYNNIVAFARIHGLSKDLLMASNVMQLSCSGHAVALFFGKGKVHYYDNAHYPPQAEVYGVEGPIYQEAFCFKDKDINAMDEEEFLTCLFKEISYRLKQVADVRGKKIESQTSLYFFERPLVKQ